MFLSESCHICIQRSTRATFHAPLSFPRNRHFYAEIAAWTPPTNPSTVPATPETTWVGSYGYLFVDGVDVLSFKNEFDPVVMLLFSRDNVRPASRSPDLDRHPEEGEEGHQLEFAISAKALLDRLDALGIGPSLVADTFDALRLAKIETYRDWASQREYPYSDDLRAHWIECQSELERWTLPTWKAMVKGCVARREQRFGVDASPLLSALFDLWEEADPRILLRALAESLPEAEVVLDLNELVGGGWVSAELDPRHDALEHFGWAVRHGAPVVVLTEGSSDVEVLTRSLKLLYPHLDGFLRFVDFTHGGEGGAAALRRTIRSFAAAGIANRVIAIFDNDTAAAEVLRGQWRSSLPPTIAVIQYPDISLGDSYPTTGPNGSDMANVNGRAGSIELYLGVDVLTDEDGSLRPVQWTSYSGGVGAYQGVLMRKAELLRRFRAKASTAGSDKSVMPGQDWSGIEAIFAKVLQVLSTTPIPAPQVASHDAPQVTAEPNLPHI